MKALWDRVEANKTLAGWWWAGCETNWGWGRKGREERLLLDSGDSGPVEGPRMKAGGETEQNGKYERNLNDWKIEDRQEATSQGRNGDLELEVKKKILGVLQNNKNSKK